MFALIIENIWKCMGVFIMWLTRREILEQLGRLGIRTLRDLKKACREFESYWYSQHYRM
jgi:predicted DNA-binding ArsR family transcriptional regulator